MNKTQPAKARIENSRRFKVGVTNFGPIETAEIELKPLSVFIGKSNTGKTYLATLIYVIHQQLGGFPRLPFSVEHDYIPELENLNFESLIESLSSKTHYSDLPESLSNFLFSSAFQENIFKKSIIKKITTTFEENNLRDLLLSTKKNNTMSITFGWLENENQIWSSELTATKSRLHLETKFISDLSISKNTLSYFEQLKRRFEHSRLGRYSIFRIFERVFEAASHPESGARCQAHYLPAVRSGIMQSHRVVASAALQRITYAGLEDTRIIPRLPKTSIDFIQNLLSVNEKSIKLYRPRNALFDELQKNIHSIADKFEELILGGKIESYSEIADGYPEMYYHPNGSSKKFTLSQSSSMVTELAPIIVFVKNFVSPYDLVILEEPEAHLHPAAQVTIAECIAMLIRNNVKVIITTHSDWFLTCLNKLILKGELLRSRGEFGNESLNSCLLRSEVGVWNFVRDNKFGTRVRELEFGDDDGIETEDMEDVAISLYNEVAHTRNSLAADAFNKNRSNGKLRLFPSDAFTPHDIANWLSVDVKQVRRKLKKYEIKPKSNNRYLFTKDEFDKLCEILEAEFDL